MPRGREAFGLAARGVFRAITVAVPVIVASSAPALAQAPPSSAASSAPPPATGPAPAAPRPHVPPPLPSARVAPRASTPAPNAADMEARIRQLEALIQSMPSRDHVRELEGQVRSLSGQVDRLSTQLRAARSTTGNRGRATVPRTGGVARMSTRGGRLQEGSTAGVDSPTDPVTGGTVPNIGAGAFSDLTAPTPNPPTDADGGANAGESEEVVGGISDVGPAAEAPSARFEMPEPVPKRKAQAMFGPGFQIRTPDDEFDIQFHNLTQLDGRFYGIGNQKPVSDTFDIAREWFIFNGHLTKPYEYYISLVDAFTTVAPLDLFLNVNYNKKLQFRFGRFKSPFTYEFYGQGTQGLPNGEWSVFFNNFGMNRSNGFMLWGQSVADRVDYAAGMFNSVPNGLVNLSNNMSVISFLNIAPFRPNQGSVLENLNIGGSLVAGDQDYAPVPNVLRTIVPTAGSNVLGVPFLQFNNNVLAQGPRALWDLHAAYFYRGLSLIAEWQSGYVDYALANQNSGRVHLPVDSYYVQAAYLLTGERVASRGMVKPLSPFDLRRGKFGIGAWEVAARFAHLQLGNQVFTGGLADPSLWTNGLYTFDLGVNWYWNQYVRVLFDWQHAGFASPVLYRPGGFAGSSDLFMLRFQIWF